MVFEKAWNPALPGGSFDVAEQQILEDIGPRPAKGYQLHIVNHERGFVRGNLMWVTASANNRQQLHKIVAQQAAQLREHERKISRLQERVKKLRKRFEQRSSSISSKSKRKKEYDKAKRSSNKSSNARTSGGDGEGPGARGKDRTGPWVHAHDLFRS